MAKAKSQYNFIINADANVINQIIFDYLRANNFQQKQENGCVYYEQYNALTGRCLFEYNIAGNQVTIWAYVGSYKSPKELSGFVGALPKQAYRDSLQLLFNHLEALNHPQNNAPQQQAFDYQPNMQQANAFEQQSKKSRDNWTIAGFVISIVGLFLSFFGIVYGVIIIVLEYYLGITGLKSNRKGLAVATIVLSSISLLITIFMFIINFIIAIS